MAEDSEVSKEELALKAWDFHKHADNLLTSRVNFGIVSQSMLVSGYASLLPYVANKPRVYIAEVIVCLLGVFYSISQLYLLSTIRKRRKAVRPFLLSDPIYASYTSVPSTGTGDLQTHWIPTFSVASWIILLVTTFL